ncbi:hypothetical protein ACS5PK_09590 [Roseateles sp. DB2]|uniref:hypothetical protein n=1 Tax=Roseateles sp. DB2 TaxID=3453717 RepID=UPI003EEA6084
MNEKIELLGEALAVELSDAEVKHVSGGGANVATRENSCSDPKAGGAVVCTSQTDNIYVD